MDLSFLVGVDKPTRYTGGEVNEVVKDEAADLLHVALAFPEAYEIGMSYPGMKILYGRLNGQPDVWAERVFMPMPDMEEAMAAREIPLYALESRRAFGDFDVIGFSLLFELTYTNVLHMLRLGGIPVRSSQRGDGHPLVIAGGPCACNPEPMADFVDAFFIGDGEEGFLEIVDAVRTHGREDRAALLRALAQIEGVYVPSLYETGSDPQSGMTVVAGPKEDEIPFPVRRRIVWDLDTHPFPESFPVPNLEVVHDRYSVEIARGCSVGCRFCQAGILYRPYRERSPEAVRKAVRGGLERGGYNEATLLSLNTGDYREIEALASAVARDGKERSAAVSLPSLRASSLTPELVASLGSGRKSGFTIAPEAGTQRLRDVVNKKITDEEIPRAAAAVYGSEWRAIKLYFMLGLPTETDEDIEGIPKIAKAVILAGREAGCKSPRATVSVSYFVPKPFTPFQWFPMERPESLLAKRNHVRHSLRRPVDFKSHDMESSLVEALFSRGDRRLGRLLEKAAALGCRFDGWTEHFRWDLWKEAMEHAGVDFDAYVHRERSKDELLPWDVVDSGVRKAFLWKEWERALKGETTPDCSSESCAACGDFAKRCKEGEFERTSSIEEIDQPAVEGGEAVPEPPPKTRYRMVFRKEGPARFIGHLDLVDVLIRALHRSGVRLAYSQGFHPSPRVEPCAPLPLGVEGREEWLQFEAAAIEDLPELLRRLGEALPRGLEPTTLYPAPEGATPLSAYTVQYYEVDLGRLTEAEREAVCGRTEEFLASDEWVIVKESKRKRREIDLRKRVTGLRMDKNRLHVALRTGGFMDLLAVLAAGLDKGRLDLARVRLEVPVLRTFTEPDRIAWSGRT